MDADINEQARKLAVLEERMNSSQTEQRSGFDRLSDKFDALQMKFEAMQVKFDALLVEVRAELAKYREQTAADAAKKREEDAKRETRLILTVVSVVGGGVAVLVLALAILRYLG